MEDCLWITELPFANFHGVGKFLLSRLARQHVTVVLTGEGSDELFLGYNVFQENKGGMSHHIANRHKGRNFRAPRKVRAVVDALGFVPMPEHSQSLTEWGRRITAIIFRKDRRADALATHPLDLLKRRIKRSQVDGNSHARKVQYFWIKSMLAPYLLCMLGDRAEMSHSIEGRTPFLDHHLFELARTIPDEVKIRNGVEKHVLREAFKNDLTDELYKRAKWPYSAPPMCIRKGQSRELDHLLDRHLCKESIERSGLFSWATVRTMLAIARWFPFRFEAVHKVHAGLILVLTVQILDELFVRNFEKSYAERARATAP
jgi:asparagine synthase (glutamine-hydrolysing)